MYIALVKGGGGTKKIPVQEKYTIIHAQQAKGAAAQAKAEEKMLAQTQDEQKIKLRKIAHCSSPGGLIHTA